MGLERGRSDRVLVSRRFDKGAAAIATRLSERTDLAQTLGRNGHSLLEVAGHASVLGRAGMVVVALRSQIRLIMRALYGLPRVRINDARLFLRLRVEGRPLLLAVVLDENLACLLV